MAVDTKDLTIYDFVDWCKQQVDGNELTSLMTSFGYPDSSTETIVEAIDDPKFNKAFGSLVRSSLSKEKSYFEMARAAGEVTTNDWLAIAASTLGAFGTTIGSILGTPKTTTATTTTTTTAATTATAKSTMLWIILAVVIIAVVVILWLSTSRKK